MKDKIDFGETRKYMYALERTEVLVSEDQELRLSVNEFGKGRAVYMIGLPYSFENSRLLYRAILWSSGDEANINKWFSTNYNVEVHAYMKNGKYCVVNNTYEPQPTTVYRGTEAASIWIWMQTRLSGTRSDNPMRGLKIRQFEGHQDI